MLKRYCVGSIVLAGLLTGCGASAQLVAGRQLPMVAPQGGINVPLNDTSELHFNLQGFRMGVGSLAGRQTLSAQSTEPTPWLRYRLHF